ncbi:hypothetical protein D7U77_06560 [Stenotrophomonas maltophilia]|uniref:hypothetical protein n=1 Tax=Stenotrophomonas maltophilia TaxID=40324 RepID=UPI0015DDE38D|nr:hypothetical protein [Stenotrophomonas maltophilia]MBA0272297.1 hypothetical protein [Stenotrophomonas maltophilia]
MPQKLIDQTTIQPDGRPGDDAFTAFATCNENFQDAEQRLVALGARIDQEAADRGQHVAAESAIREAADAALSARIPGKNIVINGDFRFWQRGTSFVGMTNGAYTADRFIPVMVGDTIDCIRAEHPLGDPTNLFNARYFMRCSVGQIAGNGSLATLQYRIENGVRLLAGKTVTVSMLVRASSATKMGIEFEMTFGTGGSPSPSIYGNSKLVTGITGGWQRISRTFTLADIAGKTFGTATEGYLSLILWLDAGSNWDARSAGVGRQAGDFQFSNIQIEIGSVATDFEQRNDAIELVLCQRYYEKSYNLGVAPGTATREGSHTSGALTSYLLHAPTVRFSQRKRSTPAIAFYNAQNGAAGQISEYGADGLHLTNKPAGINVVGSMSFEAFVPNGTATPGNVERFQWTADAEL